jgi:hypothetical protein
MAGSFFYNLLLPHVAVDPTSVTLSTTDLPLVATGYLPPLGNFFTDVGKRLRIEMLGRITTGATPGNLTFDVYWGTNAAANGTILASSAAQALTASQTNLSWMLQLDIQCRAIGNGTLGSLLCTGLAMFNEAVVTPHMLIPPSAPAAVSSLDLTAANYVSVQAKRSGSTAETMQVHRVDYFEVN